jgi:lipopolysaccharide/colanic/teichoic acid biosynthesis glycosyltransferase
MPEKLRLNLYYIKHQSFKTDIKIIFDTFKKVF